MYSIKLTGDIMQLSRRLRAMSELDLREANKGIAQALKTSTRERFKEETSPEGKKWETSIRATQKSGVTLTDTGRLKNSIRIQSDKTGVAVGTNTIYARTHQFGETGRNITIRAKTARGLVFMVNGRWIRKQEIKIKYKTPARPFLGVSEEDLEEIKETLKERLQEE